MLFYLGTHRPSWLGKVDVPLFVSRRTLPSRKKIKPIGRWALDSGGFSELSMYGHWRTSAARYAAEAQRWQEWGGMDWAAVQDWMCEPAIVGGGPIAGRVAPGTGLSVLEHQERTVQSYLDLRALAPAVPWAPVLQGWEPEEYIRHVELYRSAGVELKDSKVVGLGSVCRRQATGEMVPVIRHLATREGIRLHGFGIKLLGLPDLAPYLASSDSMAWSYDARRRPYLLDECKEAFAKGLERTHKNCGNCMRFALRWRQKVLRCLEGTGESKQLEFDFGFPNTEEGDACTP